MAGVKLLELSVANRAHCVYAKFEDEAKSWRVTFYLTLADWEKSFNTSSPRCLKLTLLAQISSASKISPGVISRSSVQKTFSAKKALTISVKTGYSPAVITIHNVKGLDLEATRFCRLVLLKSV